MPALSIAIVGGGIGGLAAANALLQRGHDVRVYEQTPALSEVGAGVAIAPNGLRALRHLGFGAELFRSGCLLEHTMYYRSDGAEIGPILPPGTEQLGLHRADLLELLARGLPSGAVHTGFQCTGFEQDAREARLSQRLRRSGLTSDAARTTPPSIESPRIRV